MVQEPMTHQTVEDETSNRKTPVIVPRVPLEKLQGGAGLFFFFFVWTGVGRSRVCVYY